MFAVYFLLLVLPLVSAQVEVSGLCHVPPTAPDFNIHATSGLWYEIARIPTPRSRGACVTLEFQMLKGDSYGFGKYTQLLNGGFSSVGLGVRVSNSRVPAQLQIQASENGQTSTFWVLRTNYNNYAVLYCCKNLNDSHLKFAWIISRMPYLDPKSLDEAKNALRKQGIYDNMMELTDQSCYTETHRKY